MDSRFIYAVGALLLIIISGVLLVPQPSPDNELPPVSEPPLKGTEGVDVRQQVNITYYMGESRTLVNDSLIYDADTKRGYNVITAVRVADNETVSEENDGKKYYYMEPAPSQDGFRLYSLDTENSYPNGIEFSDSAENDSDFQYAVIDEHLYKYELIQLNESFYDNDTTARELFSDESGGEFAYLAYKAINQNNSIGFIDSDAASPNYTADGTTVTRDGIVYERYTAHNSWTSQSGDTKISAYAANGTVLYNDTIGYYGYADVSYNTVNGNTLLSKFAQQGTIFISDNILPDSVDTTTEGRLGIDVRYNATIKHGAVESSDVPCPTWTKRVGPTPSCHNTTA